MKRVNTDLVGGLIMIMSALFFWSQMGNLTVYAELFPKAVILVLLMLGVGLLIKAKVKPLYKEIFVEDDRAKMIIISIIGLCWVLLLDKIGFIVTSFLAMTIAIWTLEEEKSQKKFMTTILIAGGEVLIFYLTFSKLFLVPLPEGILF